MSITTVTASNDARIVVVCASFPVNIEYEIPVLHKII